MPRTSSFSAAREARAPARPPHWHLISVSLQHGRRGWRTSWLWPLEVALQPLRLFNATDSSAIVGEYPVGGAAVPATRAAWAFAEPPINTLTTSNPGVVGPGVGRAYTAAFGGLSSPSGGAETSTLAYYYPDSNSWTVQSQLGGTAAALPAARQGCVERADMRLPRLLLLPPLPPPVLVQRRNGVPPQLPSEPHGVLRARRWLDLGRLIAARRHKRVVAGRRGDPRARHGLRHRRR